MKREWPGTLDGRSETFSKSGLRSHFKNERITVIKLNYIECSLFFY